MASSWAKAAVNQPSANHVGKAVERIIKREAAMLMPERVWAVRLPKFRTNRDQGVTVAATSECLVVPPPDDATEYVLATTHQRTLEALREAEKAIRNAYGAITSGQTEDKDAAGTLRAALAAMGEREAVKAELWAVARDAKKRAEALLLAKSLREIAERKADELNHHPGRITKPEELVEWKAADLIERMAAAIRSGT